MINNDKIGSYIKELRTKKNLTQEELGNMIYVSRQAVSNWERGIDVPTIDNVKDIGKIFDVSIIDIYAGEKVKDIKTLNDVIHSLITLEIKKSKKILIISSFIIFILVVMFLTYYFITYYNNISVYTITTDDNSYKAFGVINKSVDNIYFNLALDQKVDRLCLIYNEENLICESDSNYIVYTEMNGYNEIIPLKSNSFNDYINNMYLSIDNNNNIEKIKLNIVKDYQNSNFIKENKNEINNNDNYELEFASVPEKIKKEFEYNEKEKYFYLDLKKNNYSINMMYFIDFNSFNIIECSGDIIKKIIYNNNDSVIESYDLIDNNNNVINSLTNISNKDNNKSKKKIYKYFKENYIDKYLN